jgi:hypothetical protein
MLTSVLTALTAGAIVVAGAPHERRATAPVNKVIFSWENKPAAAGTTHQYSEVSGQTAPHDHLMLTAQVFRVPQYYLQPANGVSWTPADRFTSFTVETVSLACLIPSISPFLAFSSLAFDMSSLPELS